MRWLVLTLAALLAMPSAAVAQVVWAKAYEEGVEAFQKGNDALAEQKLIEARNHPRAPKQSRKALFSSVDYRAFIPDYYLGVIYARQGRHKQAQEFLERALRDQLVKQEDKVNYALATSSLQRARDEETRLASNVRPPPPPESRPPVKPPVTTTTNPPPTTTTATPINPVTPKPSTDTGTAVTPPPVRPQPTNTGVTPPPVRLPPPPAEPAWLADFRRAMNASRASLQKARYSEARSSLASATSVAGDAARRQEAEALRREIDSAQKVAVEQAVERANRAILRKDPTTATSEVAALRDLSPGHAAIGELTRGINSLIEGLDRTARLANAERTGVKLFLSGQYKEAGDILEQAVTQSLTSPRVHLFLASSRGAQALLAPQDQRPALVEAARKHYALAKPGEGRLTADERFISPSILQLLTGS
jgi:tetratricopeptide (TPR) repeat protein